MPENIEYRVGQVENRVIDNEKRNTAAHKEFYEHETARRAFETGVNERCEIRCKDIEDLKKATANFSTFMATTNLNYTNLSNSITQLAVDVKSLKEKPGKRWESIVGTAITVAVTAIISYLFTIQL